MALMAGACSCLKTTVIVSMVKASSPPSGSSRNSSNSKDIEYGVVELPENTKNSRVLVLGGTGRVGGSTAIALSKFCPDLRIRIAGRNREKGASMVSMLGGNSEFIEFDFDNTEALESALSGVDLVVHAAGPFQQSENCTVLEAAIKTKTAYLDVCDDTNYATRAKTFNDKALAANIPAITTGGIYPGVSNVMAAELVRVIKSEGKGEPEKLRFYYYTAGSGGAGPTILATSFLLLGEEVAAFNKGKLVKLKPYSGMLQIDFGRGVGKKNVYLLNLPEVKSAHEILQVPTVSARFGTAPFFWNWGMEIMTAVLPAEYLRNKKKVQQLVEWFDPLVRAVDGIAGERVSMRVDLECSGDLHTIGVFTHKRLSVLVAGDSREILEYPLLNEKAFLGLATHGRGSNLMQNGSVGTSTAAFALSMLEGSTQPGVWFPEEPEGIAIEAREVLLQRASQGTINFAMHKAPWMIETNPKELGLGIYV